MGSVIKCNLLAQPVAAGLHTHTSIVSVCVCVTVTVNLDAKPKTTTINTQTTHIKNERKKRTAQQKLHVNTRTHTGIHTYYVHLYTL